MIWAVLGLAATSLGFAGTAIAMTIKRARLATKLAAAEADRDLYHDGLHRLRNEMTKRELSRSRDQKIVEDRLKSCRDLINGLPDARNSRALIRHHLDVLLSGETD